MLRIKFHSASNVCSCQESKGGPDGQHLLTGVNETAIIADRVLQLLNVVQV
jgi:hypothetical protein